MIGKATRSCCPAMNLPQKTVPFVAHPPKTEALETIDVLQNLAFLIEQQSNAPEDVRAYAQSMHLVLDSYARRFRMPSAHPAEPELALSCAQRVVN